MSLRRRTPERFATIGRERLSLDRKVYDATVRALVTLLFNQRATDEAIAFNRKAKTPADIFVFGLDETGSMREQGEELNTLTARLPHLFANSDLLKTAFLQIAAFSFGFLPNSAREVAEGIPDAIRPMMDLTAARNVTEIRPLQPVGGTPLNEAVYAMLYAGLKSAERFKGAKRNVRRISVTAIGDGEHTVGIIERSEVKALAEYIRAQGFTLEFNLFAVQKDMEEEKIEEMKALAAELGGAFAHGDIEAVLGLTLKSALMPRDAFLKEFGVEAARPTGPLTSEFVDPYPAEDATTE